MLCEVIVVLVLVIQMKTIIKTYSQLIQIPTFEERFEYLKLKGSIGKDTFGHDRYLNQLLYSSNEWRSFRRNIILRDNGFDLAHPDYVISKYVTVHHINPITPEDILINNPSIFDPENAITTADTTHRAIHYGDYNQIKADYEPRSRFDTCPWKGVK